MLTAIARRLLCDCARVHGLREGRQPARDRQGGSRPAPVAAPDGQATRQGLHVPWVLDDPLHSGPPHRVRWRRTSDRLRQPHLLVSLPSQARARIWLEGHTRRHPRYRGLVQTRWIALHGTSSSSRTLISDFNAAIRRSFDRSQLAALSGRGQTQPDLQLEYTLDCLVIARYRYLAAADRGSSSRAQLRAMWTSATSSAMSTPARMARRRPWACCPHIATPPHPRRR